MFKPEYMINTQTFNGDLFYLKSVNTGTYYKFSETTVNGGICGFAKNKEEAAIFTKDWADFIISISLQNLVAEKVEK